MKQRQQNSTSYPITFLMIDSSDHITGKVGLTPTVTLSKNGAAFGAAAGAVSEIGGGWYALAGNATDLNTLGDLLIHATATGADPVDDRYCIVPWNPFDAVRLGLTALPNATAGTNGGLALVGSAMTLTADYDAAKTAASQTSVNDLPTNAELAAALAGADDAVLAAIAALNNLSAAGAQAAAAAALAAYGAALETTAQSIKLKTDLLDISAITVNSGIDGDELTIYHGATFDETITGLTIPTDWVKVLFTYKDSDDDTDANARLQVQESNPGVATDGMIRINGAAPGTGENARAELTVNQAGGSVRVKLHQLCAVALLPKTGRWDLKVITSDSPAEGTPLVVSSPAAVAYTTTRSTS